MRCYDINYVDDHICATDPSQKVLDSWVRIKKDAAEALNPSHNQLKAAIALVRNTALSGYLEVPDGLAIDRLLTIVEQRATI